MRDEIEPSTGRLKVQASHQQARPTTCEGIDQASQAAARGTLQVADLGPRFRTRRSQALHDGNRHRRVLLRSAESLAARIQREYQSLATTVFPPRHRSFGSQSGPIAPGGKRTQRTASQDARLCLASRTISSLCCVDRVKRQLNCACQAATSRPSFLFRAGYLTVCFQEGKSTPVSTGLWWKALDAIAVAARLLLMVKKRADDDTDGLSGGGSYYTRRCPRVWQRQRCGRRPRQSSRLLLQQADR
jgi:hypothetical protein